MKCKVCDGSCGYPGCHFDELEALYVRIKKAEAELSQAIEYLISHCGSPCNFGHVCPILHFADFEEIGDECAHTSKECWTELLARKVAYSSLKHETL